MLSRMSHTVAMHVLLFVVTLPLGCAPAQGDTVLETEWCTVTVEGEPTTGERLPVRVEYRGIQEPTKLCVDLHWLKEGGEWGGMLGWGGPYPEVEGDGSHLFRPMVAPKPGIESATVLVFLSPDGSFGGRTREARSEPIPVKIAARDISDATFKKSWIWIDPIAIEETLVEGEAWDVPVEYYLDPSEDDGMTELVVWAPGPWIDNPDGTYTERRHHVGYPGTSKRIQVEAGREGHVFEYTVPPAKQRNAMHLIAYFQRAGGQKWPWEVRSERVYFHRADGWFELETDRPGNLFTYDEDVRVLVRLREAAAGEGEKTLTYTVHDYRGQQVADGEVTFTAEKAGQIVPIDLELDWKGTFLIQAEVAGWEKRHMTFARVPDIMAITDGETTRFGMTNVVSPGDPDRIDELCRIARRIGLTTCRVFFNWNRVEPAKGDYRLEAWDRPIDIARERGISPWMCIVNPPAWARKGEAGNVSYRAFTADLEGWQGVIRTITERYRGKLLGWEWLNEIVPGGSEQAVEDYLDLVRTGTNTAGAIDPDMTMLLAGGLWPRNFRQALLKAGVAEYVDVLPVHYGHGGAVIEARGDLDAVGAEEVEVWDDESARGISIWDAPPLFDMTHTLQSNWILTNWADELAAGCKRIIYFGGPGTAAGNWSYLLSDMSPRPVAATLAVFISRMHGAEPVGKFALGEGGMFHLFEKGGEAVVLASSYVEGENVSLNVGADSVQIVDYQGNARTVNSAGGTAQLTLGKMRCYIDGADLDVLKTYLVPEIAVREASLAAQGHLKDTAVLVGTPRTRMLRGREGSLFVRVRNLYDRELEGRLGLDFPTDWGATADDAFAIGVGEEKVIPVNLRIPAEAEPGDRQAAVTVHFKESRLPSVEKPLVVSVISRDHLGNILPNAGFEQAGDTEDEAAGWRGNAKRIAAEGLGDGLGGHVLKFTDTGDEWNHHGRTIPVRGGETYLYTAWVWSEDVGGGSNVTLHFADGTQRSLYNLNVFALGEGSDYWQLYTAKVQTPPNTVSLGITPVVKGSGWALYDNLRVTAYEGSDFAADCTYLATPPVIDGSLEDWPGGSAIPLIGENQLTTFDDGYDWTPENLSAIARLAWDEKNLYVGVKVRDDRHIAMGGERAEEGDSLTIGFDPTNRGPGSTERAFCYYVSSAAPGSGSGLHTLYRPQEQSGGLRSGHLARDSSVYELSVRRDEGVTMYEMRLPLSELGGITPAVGAGFGLSIQLNDNDGDGVAAAMNWGDGLNPAWAPGRFGVVTLVE